MSSPIGAKHLTINSCVSIHYSVKLVYPNPAIKVLQSLQGQFSRIHDLIPHLNSSRLLQSFSTFGNISFHTIGPKHPTWVSYLQVAWVKLSAPGHLISQLPG